MFSIVPIVNKLSPASPYASVIQAKLDDLIPESQNILLYNSDFVQRHPASPRHIIAGCQSMRDILTGQSESGEIGADDKKRLEQTINEITGSEVAVDIEVFEAALDLLRELNSEDTALQAFKDGVRKKAPLAMKFASVDELEARRAKWVEEEKEDVQPNDV